MTIEQMKNMITEAAEKVLNDDIEVNKAIGQAGAEFLLRNRQNGERLAIMTHCNTGSLATSGYGTALGVIRSLHEKGRIDRVYCTETRPFKPGVQTNSMGTGGRGYTWDSSLRQYGRCPYEKSKN